MERAVQIFAIINLAIIGISHVARPREWVDFIGILRDRGEPGVFAVAILGLSFGSFIVSFHNVWSGLPLVLTLLGWANVLKALIYLTFPAFGLRRLQSLSRERSKRIAGVGMVLLLLAGVLGYHVWSTA